MKRIFSLLLAAVCLTVGVNVSAQDASKPATYILVRHAEKQATGGADPALTPEGEQRAQKLIETLKGYVPDAVYSTNYVRTRSTVTPLATKFGKEIQLYNPGKQAEFANQLLDMKGKTVVIVGHSNTIPALVNLLAKNTKFPDWSDSVYDHYFIVTVNAQGEASAKELTF